jgi:REP element-mobilizing transposase RayT
MHFSFKTKYCHNIFDDFGVRNATKALLLKACRKYNIPQKTIGFDSNHVHGRIDIGVYSRPQVAKMLKGFVAKKLFEIFPWLKERFFWGSGLWSPAYFMDAVGKDADFVDAYIMKQKYAQEGFIQMKLISY